MSDYAALIAEDALISIGETAATLFRRLDRDGVFGFVSDYDRPRRIQEIADFVRDGIIKMAAPDIADHL
jgi:hypothetical protein